MRVRREPDPPTEPQLEAIAHAVTPVAPASPGVMLIDHYLGALHGRHAVSATEVRDLLLDVRNLV